MNPPRRSFARLLLALLPGVLLGSLCPPVARGDELTRQVQEELRKRNLYFGDVDGRFTAQIAAALRRYQQRKGFEASGQVDETTLRSLSLVAPVAAGVGPVATVEVASTPVAAVRPPVPWPDLPVLRSDQGRQKPPPEESLAEVAEPTPESTPKPPPAAVAQRWPGESVVRSFVADYLRTGESNVPGAQEEFYSRRVDYFNEGMVDGRFIAKDTARYNKRWPERHFTLVEPVELTEATGESTDRFAVNFRCRFAVRHPGNAARREAEKSVAGETKNTYVIERTGPDSMRIVSLKEERVRGK